MPEDSPRNIPRRLSGHNPSALLRLGLTPRATEPPLEVPGYELLESLGCGGMGEVFRARQESLDREVAVKVLRHDLGAGDWLPERFEREARTMATVRHANVVTVHDCLRLEDGRAAIVMELIHGGTLRQRIAAAPDGLPLPQVLRWARETAEGLRVAHEAGVTHRDVKPENILIDDTGAARVSDFGLAFSEQAATTHLTPKGRALGTLGYMAPEQLRGAAVDPRTDVFSLGVVLYEMVTGRLPQGSFRPARELRPDLPAALCRLIDAALRPDPDQRPADMDAVLRCLDRIERNPSDAFFNRRHALATAGLAGVAAVAWWWSRHRPQRELGVAQEAPWQRLAWPSDPATSAIMGGWQLDGGTLVSDEQICILPVVRELPSSWRVRLRFRRMTGKHSIAIFFRTPEGTGTFTLASWSSDLAGVQAINGRTLQEVGAFVFEVENERSYEWIVEYRAGRTRIWINGELKQERDVTGQPLSVVSPWEWTPNPDSPALLIGSWHSATHFEWLELRPL